MAGGTTLSRLSGFARLLAVGWVLGQGRLADAYNQANTVPNTIYDLLLGGVLSATLLPVLMGSLGRAARGRDEDAVPAVVTLLTIVLVVATGLFWLAAPIIVHFLLLRATGPGVAGERALATSWLRYFTPQLLFIGLITITTALLNARRRFASVAFSPVLANLVTIAALIVADRLVPRSSVSAYRAGTGAVEVLGIGTTAGYLVQLFAQVPALVRARIPLRFCWQPGHPALRAIARLSGWTVGAVVANQISFYLVYVLANTKAGNLSAFLYSYTFMQLPYAVIAVSIAYVVAPDLAQLWTAGDPEGFAGRAGYAIRATIAFLLPAGVGYALVARQTVRVALAHGHLGVSSAGLTGTMLMIFAFGLPGFSTYLLIMRAFQAKQDTRSMFWLYVAENATTVIAALLLYPALGARGLVIAWIGAYTLMLPFAWVRLRKSVPLSVPVSSFSRTALATTVMAGAVVGLGLLVPIGQGTASSAGRLVLLVSVGAVVFVTAARAVGVKELGVLSARYRALRA
jgi:putative peptidoglycan lipid II flippase